VLQDGSSLRVALASQSLVYCFLAAHGDAAVLIDARTRAAFDQTHVCGSWHLRNAGGEQPDAVVGSVKSRCGLRSVAVLGQEVDSLRDKGVLQVLAMLHKAAVRPKGPVLVLRQGVASFARRFPFCMRSKGAEKETPLPPCPAELLGPGWSGTRRPPTVYIGSEACVVEPSAGPVFSALNVRTVINTNSKPLKTPHKRCSVVTIGKGIGADGEALIAVAREGCDKVLRQSTACLVCGPACTLVASLVLAEALPRVAQSADEAEAYVRLRYPPAGVLDSAARLEVSRVIARKAGKKDPMLEEQSNAAAGVGEGQQRTGVVQDLYSQLRRRNRRGAEVALGTIQVALKNILEQPTEAKFRRLKGSNARVQREVLAHPEAVQILRVGGFVTDDQDLVLPPAAPLQALREVLAQLPAPRAAM